jgi:hypothetical protein
MTDDITLKMNINPVTFNLFQVGASVNITHNVKMFRISLPNPESVMDFETVPSYVVIKTDEKSNMKDGMRYTPISYSDQVRLILSQTQLQITSYHHNSCIAYL